jgi:hypothetical protein
MQTDGIEKVNVMAEKNLSAKKLKKRRAKKPSRSPQKADAKTPADPAPSRLRYA